MTASFTPPDRSDIDAWCRLHLGAAPRTVLFEETHLSVVQGLRLEDGREVVLKARPDSARIAGGVRLQAFMWREGFPCPEPLAGPAPLVGLTATAEAVVTGGDEGPDNADASRDATALVEFIRLASTCPEPLDFEPPLPWMGWGHHEPGLWPTPDDVDADLNAYSEPAWLDDIARRVRERLRRDSNPRVIGHGDWWPPNLRWQDGKLHAVFDWDSIVRLSEAAIAGGTAVIYRDRWPAVTRMEQTEAFIEVYAVARGRPWTADEREVCWAAGLWQLAFNAKKQSLQGVNETLEHLRVYGDEKLRRAGL